MLIRKTYLSDTQSGWSMYFRRYFIPKDVQHLKERLTRFITFYDHFLLSLLVLCAWCFIYQEYFLFDRLFVFDGVAKDTISQFYPIEHYRVSNFTEKIFPFWSFQFSLGSNVYSEMINLSPFEIFFLFFKSYSYVEALPAVIFLRFLAAALIFQQFLKKIHFSAGVSLLGAIMYAFSGYMILNSHWYHYLDYAIFLALFLYFFEMWYQESRWMPLVLLVGIVPLKQEIQLVQVAFFAFFYISYRCINDYGIHKKIIKVYFKTAFLLGFGTLLGAYFYLPDVVSFLSSSRVGSSVQSVSLQREFSHLIDINEFFFIFSRALSPDIFYSWLSYQGEKNYFEQSTAYASVFALLSLFVLIIFKVRNKKIVWIFPVVYFFVAASPSLVSTLNIFMSGSLKYVTLYCSFFAIFSSVLVLQYADLKINSWSFALRFFIFFSALLCIVSFLFLSEDFYSDINQKLLYSSLFLLIVYFAFLIVCNNTFHYFKYILFLVILLELIAVARSTVAFTPGALHPFFYSRGERYFNPGTLQAVQYVRDHDASFYRVEKGYRDVFLNDALVQGYFGTESYLGFASVGVHDFFAQFQLSPQSPNLNSYRFGLEKHAALQSLLGVKYFLCRSAQECSGLTGFSPMHTIAGVHIYKNDHFQPFGRMYYQQISPEAFNKLSLEDKFALVTDTVVTSTAVPGVAAYDRLATSSPPRHDAENDFVVERWNQQAFAGSISLHNAGILFFPIPFDRGWRVMVNGKPYPLLQLDFGFCGVFLDSPGQYSLVLRYIPPFLPTGAAITCIGLFLACCLRYRFPKFSAVG